MRIQGRIISQPPSTYYHMRSVYGGKPAQLTEKTLSACDSEVIFGRSLLRAALSPSAARSCVLTAPTVFINVFTQVFFNCHVRIYLPNQFLLYYILHRLSSTFFKFYRDFTAVCGKVYPVYLLHGGCTRLW